MRVFVLRRSTVATRLRACTIQSALWRDPAKACRSWLDGDKRRRVVVISLLLGFGMRVAAGQLITITGRAVDAVSGRAVSGVQVTIGARTVVTDAEGRFQFDVSAGRWEIEVRARDYVPRKIAFEAASQGMLPLEIELIPGEGFQERLERRIRIAFLGRKSVDDRFQNLVRRSAALFPTPRAIA